MKLREYNIIGVLLLLSVFCFGQKTISGVVIDKTNSGPLKGVEIIDNFRGLITKTDENGIFEFSTEEKAITLFFFIPGYQVYEEEVITTSTNKLEIAIVPLSENLPELVVVSHKQKVFELQRLKDVEGTAIYAGKKTEVIQVDQSMANLATNNARQIYSQIAGLNIYQNDDGGLQLNIGGRGLDPNRTANFNVRQNGYDISADALGYPESYYTPASEGLSQIQIIRGAASLQYGTQFGGHINFKTKKPNSLKTLEVITRNTAGSFGFYSNFTSFSGTRGKLSYYAYANYKRGDGFRPNSAYESINFFSHIGYDFSKKTKLTGDITYMNYLAQQAGGLSDQMFRQNPYQSNRKRNWFAVDWFLYNFKLEHKFSSRSRFSFRFFGLNAKRSALGFRTNRVNQIDDFSERDLISSDFSNFAMETRYLQKYRLLDKNATFLLGSKYYKSNNTDRQGAGSDGSDADFSFKNDEFPGYPNQSEFDLPNTNLAIFGENIFYVNNKFSITPGFRFEYIKTESNGFFKKINFDAAGNVIDDQTVEDSRVFDRTFLLLGVGLSFKPNDDAEIYANISENYRSVTFSDINISNPAFAVDPDITDEKGYTADIGLRGNYNDYISYDVSLFTLSYQGRIGFVQKVLDDTRIISQRTNTGNAFIYGVESLLDFNVVKLLDLKTSYRFNVFVNTSLIESTYTKSQQSGIEGNEVEFVPKFNQKIGANLNNNNFGVRLQYGYLSRQFTDASNSVSASLSGVIGELPAYGILDFSTSYRYKRCKVETGVNNILDRAYFTRRATGYPGPGIIPSAPRNWFVTFQVKI